MQNKQQQHGSKNVKTTESKSKQENNEQILETISK